MGDYARVDLDPDVDALVAKMVADGDSAVEVAKKIATAAIGMAPVAEGNYRDGIRVERTKTGARVVATDQKSAWMEFGIPSRGVPSRWVLRRAAESVGMKFRKR